MLLDLYRLKLAVHSAPFCPAKKMSRVPNRFFGIRDLANFKAGIRDFEGKGERDSGVSF